MQLCLAYKFISLLKGTYLPKDKRKSFKVTIEETKRYVVEVTAVDNEHAAQVASGLKNLGLVKESPELFTVGAQVSWLSNKDSRSGKVLMANNQVTRERVRNSLARIENNDPGYSRESWARGSWDRTPTYSVQDIMRNIPAPGEMSVSLFGIDGIQISQREMDLLLEANTDRTTE